MACYFPAVPLCRPAPLPPFNSSDCRPAPLWRSSVLFSRCRRPPPRPRLRTLHGYLKAKPVARRLVSETLKATLPLPAFSQPGVSNTQTHRRETGCGRMDLNAYLRRVGITAAAPPSLAALRELHRQHLLSVPFESLSIHIGERIILDPALLYEKIVVRRRGGFCCENNGLFLWVLQELGYQPRVLSAQLPRGRLTYMGWKLITTVYTTGGGSVRTKEDLREDEIPDLLRDKFGIVLNGTLVPKDDDMALPPLVA
ncbi:uncharacterized protein LOC142463571 isoform X4 [Ascaphus truei]|uniref:uncharacterized protein LOC142463571 isoform X4 n=1 Tax=Ascaphus truei TaxID=8439 RepID=UPI003F5A58A8